MSVVLDIKNLNFSYQADKPLYKNFSLSVKKGEIVALLGESGSGKSTLLDIICGNLKAKSGEILRKKTAQIYQDPYSSFHPSYSICSQIKDALNGNLDENEREEFCRKLSIAKNLLAQKPHNLSGGELQRCSALRAMLLKPELLLADEPTSALDNITQLELLKSLIKTLDNCGILLITHDISLARWCSDKTVRLEKI